MSLREARRWLKKATYDTADLSGGTKGGLLSPEQVMEFIKVALNYTAIIQLARQESSKSTKFEVPRISFHAGRILKSGVEATRLADADRAEPVTAMLTLSTNLFKGEVLVSEEVLEDNIEGPAHADTLMTYIAEAVGRDIEEYAIKSKTTHTDGNFNDFNGLIADMDADVPAAQQYNATGITAVETILQNLLELMPARYRRDPKELRMFVPIKVSDAWENELSQRGTPLGDSVVIEGKRQLAYRGVPMEPVPLLSGNEAGIGSIDYSGFSFCTNPKNIVFGWHRKMRIRKWEDPREGAISFLPSVRFDVGLAEPDAMTFAENIGAL